MLTCTPRVRTVGPGSSAVRRARPTSGGSQPPMSLLPLPSAVASTFAGVVPVHRLLPLHAVLVGTSGTVSLNANPGQLPGGATLQQLANGIGGWALILALVALVVGAAVWALGAHTQ